MGSEPGASRWLAWRWGLDAVLAAALLLASLPLLMTLGVLIRSTSSGPAIIRVPRVGRRGSQFPMWKLRSMHGGVERFQGLTPAGDPRITRVGHVLRRSHLDELPQLLNVVSGQMALIGSRPEDPGFVDLTDPRWTAVLEARPGIVGPTQLMAHHQESAFLARAGGDGYRCDLLPVKLAIDEWYVRRASPGLDATVVIAALQHLVLRRRSSRLMRRVRREVPGSARFAADAPARRSPRSSPEAPG